MFIHAEVAEWMEAIDQEICISLEEQMQWRWGTARLEEDLEGALQASCRPAAGPNPSQGPGK